MLKLDVMLVLMMVLLVACGSDEADNPSSETAESAEEVAVTTTEVQDEIPPTLLAPEFLGQVMTPGIRTADELEVSASQTYVSPNGVGWIVLDVTNISDEIIPNVAVLVSLLNDENREVDTLRFSSPFLNIPAEISIPMVLSFTAPEDYSDFVAVVQVENYADSNPFANLQGLYDFPYTLSDLPVGEFPLQLTGTVSNNSGRPLIAPAVVVGAYNAEGEIIGAALPRLEGLSDTAEWLDGSDLTLDVTFSFLPESPTEVRVISAGYFAE